MKATVLIDNIATGTLCGEWGLSVLVESENTSVLLDFGSSGKFVDNADALNVDLSGVEYAVLSHAHYDHANGMRGFLERNEKAFVYLQEQAEEDCYSKAAFFPAYIGIKRGTLKNYAHRIRRVSGLASVCPGIWLLAHSTPDLSTVGKKGKMYRKNGRRLLPDDFSHEQSLIVETEKGLVIFNSCSHAGADTIIREVQEAFDQKKVYAIAGGFHLFRSSEAEVKQLAQRIHSTGIRKILTGHCTGDHAFEILKSELPDCAVEKWHSGFVWTV